MKIKLKTKIIIIGLSVALSGCGASNPPKMSQGHIQPPKETKDIPQNISEAPVLPAPKKRPDLETYTVVVNEVPVHDLLFSMARDAKLNLDIGNDVKGKVTMNAIDQTLPKILSRIAEQVPINYQLQGNSLHVTADKPYLQTYEVDYLNISRSSTGKVEVATEISSTGPGATNTTGGSGGDSGGNNSNTKVKNVSDNNFWLSLTRDIAKIIGIDVKSNGGKSDYGDNIIVNRESGYISVRATSRQQKQVQKFLAKVLGSAKRQVLIEATIAEVTLSNAYQAGIDWSVITNKQITDLSGKNTITESGSQNLTGGNLSQAPVFTATLLGKARGNDLSATLKALETFGHVKVLSSPKVMALNNQTAMLKVVDNQVYFTIKANTDTNANTSNTTFQTQLNTVPVGIVMSVTPYIDKNDVVMMNVRPTISRIVGTVDDPNPALANANVTSKIPVIQVREIESMLKINNGDTAVIGGLMQNQVTKHTSGVPILSSIPLIGNFFSYKDNEYVKSELVIFIRPVVMHNASLRGDLKDYRKYLEEDEDIKP